MKSFIQNFFDSCNTYILIWLLWYVHGALFRNSFTAIILYIPFLAMTLYYIVKTVNAYHPRGIMLALTVLFLSLLPYGIGLLLMDDVSGEDRKSFLMMLIGSLGPIFAFYVFARQGLLTEERMRSWLPVFLIVAIISFYANEQRVLTSASFATENKFDDITNNEAYSILGLMPFVFLLKKPIWQFLVLGFVMFFVIMGFKRGAILTSLFMVIWFVYTVFGSSSGGRNAFILFLTVILLSTGWNYINHLYETNEYFRFRLGQTMEGMSSDRDYIYSTLWNHYLNHDSYFKLIFGEGAYHTENIIGRKAHSDWLELLIDCGLFGVIVYFIYWCSFVIDWVRSRFDNVIYAMIGACLIYTFIRSFFSMSFSDMPFYLCMIMGYCFAIVQEEAVEEYEDDDIESSDKLIEIL